MRIPRGWVKTRLKSSTVSDSPRLPMISATPIGSPIRAKADWSSIRPPSEGDHAADAVLVVHEVEPAVDLVEAQAVGDEGVDVDVARQVAVDQLGHLQAALDAAERRALHPAALHEEPRHDLQD